MDLLSSLSHGSASSLSLSSQEIDMPRCSRKGCARQAEWKVLWNNPKIHTPERRKIWLACNEHKKYLENFLISRNFWKTTEPFSLEQKEFSQGVL